MTILIKREILHQMIDDLSQTQLFELAKFVEFLISKEGQSKSNFDLWELIEDEDDRSPLADPLDELKEVMRTIQTPPPHHQAIIQPTQVLADDVAQLLSDTENSLDVAAWNETWDTIEAEMEAKSLAHEHVENQESNS